MRMPGRKDVSAQLEFLKRTAFLLATNKSDNTNNNILLELGKFQSEETNFSDLISEIKNAKSKRRKVA